MIDVYIDYLIYAISYTKRTFLSKYLDVRGLRIAFIACGHISDLVSYDRQRGPALAIVYIRGSISRREIAGL